MTDDQEKPDWKWGIFLISLLVGASELLKWYNNKTTQTITLPIKEKQIDNFGEGFQAKDGKTVNAKIELFERLEGAEHIKSKLLRYLDYYGEHELNEKDKWLYVILESKVNKIQKGHVVLDHPVVTFLEGQIPRNTYHNTLAFRLSIGLNRVENPSLAQIKKEEEEKKAEEEQKEREAYNLLTDEEQE